METRVTTDKPTPVNIAKHNYFNLAGENTDTKVYDQILRLNCDKYLDFDREESTVTGEIKSVENTKYDFREYERLGDRIRVDGRWPDEGFDNFLVVSDNSSAELRNVATIKNIFNGLRLDIYSNQNGIHFYTACHLDLKKPSTGQAYGIHHGVSLDAMNYPDSVNQVRVVVVVVV
jgi:aldose 1-epimerase